MTGLRLHGDSPRTVSADALVVGVSKGPDGPVLAAVPDLDEALGATLPATVKSLGGTGAAGEVTKVPTLGALPTPLLAAVGLGPAGTAVDGGDAASYDAEELRRAAGAGIRALAGCRSVALALPAAGADQIRAVAEGALLGAYTFTRYRHSSLDAQQAPPEELTVLTDQAQEADVAAAVERARQVAPAVCLVRDWVNTPPADLFPDSFATLAAQAAREAGLEVEVLDEEGLRAGGYGGVLGVGQGSIRPPRLVKIRYRPEGAGAHLALVGKGITFDSGGLSLKPSQAMEWMKADMAGAAAVIAATIAIARLRLPVQVSAWAPMAENMPSGTAQRPSDVLTTYGGRTVEVLNTDAEGRLILADALAAASEEGPDLIVDVATLTGAQLVALGSRTAAIMSNDDEVRAQVHDAATRAGEAMWPMPLPDELRKSMDTEIADIANMGDKYGGMLVAGLFLREFVGEGLKWAHLDIAGPSFNSGPPYGYTPKGGTGAAVRTLVQVAADLAQGRA